MRISDWSSDVCSSDLASRDLVFKNSYKDIEGLLALLTPLGTRFEFECYDTSHLYNLAHFLDRGLVKAPLFVQTCFGILGGIGSHPDDIMHMKRTADRLFGDQYRSEEHTSELQSLMRISYAVFCLKKKNKKITKLQL